MANVLNRTTLRYNKSVNTPDYPSKDWVINPDMSAVEGTPTKYWKLTGDVVTVMSEAERDAVDIAAEESVKESIAKKVDGDTSLKALYLSILEDINELQVAAGLNTTQASDFKTKIRSKL